MLGRRSSSGGTRKPRVSVKGFADVRGEDDHIYRASEHLSWVFKKQS